MKFTLTEVLTIEEVHHQFVEGAITFRKAEGWELYEKSCSHLLNGLEDKFTLRFQRLRTWENRR